VICIDKVYAGKVRNEMVPDEFVLDKDVGRREGWWELCLYDREDGRWSNT
jgi:hypothetical protein